MNIVSGFADISLLQLLLVGYGTGALMPLVLVPLSDGGRRGDDFLAMRTLL